MKKLNQNGSAHLVAILVVVVMGIVGFTGWKVYDSNQKTKKSLDNASNSGTVTAQKKAEAKKEASIPEGYIEYDLKALRLKFVYPKTWGDITVSDGSEKTSGHLISGEEKQLTFSTNKYAGAGYASEDWAHNDRGHGGMANFIVIEDYEKTKTGVAKYSTIHEISKKDAFYYETVCAIFCSGPKTVSLTYEAHFKLTATKNYDVFTIGFHTAEDSLALENKNVDNIDLDGKKGETYKSEANEKIIRTITESIKEY